MKAILTFLLTILLALLGLTVGGGLLLLLAYGLGWLLNHLLRFDSFQVTLLSLASVVAFGFLVNSLWQRALETTLPSDSDFDEDEDDEADNEDEPEFEVKEVDGEPVIYPSIPRWRQPLKNPDFSNARPDDRCPCGSGRKYKNCHGTKQGKGV